jgi:phage gp46-like protein
MSDVMITITADGGDIEILNGAVTMTDSLQTAVGILLFGGNVEDDGTRATEAKQWWGNVIERDQNKRIRSRTQAMIRSLPLTSSALSRIDDAAAADLAVLSDEGIASSIAVATTVVNVRAVRVSVQITGIDGSLFAQQYLVENT